MSHLHYCPACHVRWDHDDYMCFSMDIPCPPCERAVNEEAELPTIRGWDMGAGDDQTVIVNLEDLVDEEP